MPGIHPSVLATATWSFCNVMPVRTDLGEQATVLDDRLHPAEQTRKPRCGG
ncbi:hypothetical protein NYP18_09675 [Corynebacterium sp. YIM 101645]|uniref:Transposase n=1 Tax=Corynebacterium lemuris TaxID=1859292 RepID=A0ABT2FXF5_9CORY|nr:hypothetical protein [Corynebacterium lemuris]MCS5479923.1 hypothetical protein [Corynebacterium lemuris]